MEIPVIDLGKLTGDERRHTMSALHEACEKWGFFWVEKHGIREEVMEKVKKEVNEYYEECMEERFYSSEVAKAVEAAPAEASDADWESSFFYRHQPDSNIAAVPAVLRSVGYYSRRQSDSETDSDLAADKRREKRPVT